MNISWGSPQNYYRGDRWSQDWCSDTKIPLFLDLRAPPVANGAGSRSIGNKMLKLTFHLRVVCQSDPLQKQTLTEVAKLSGFLRKKLLKAGVYFANVIWNIYIYIFQTIQFSTIFERRAKVLYNLKRLVCKVYKKHKLIMSDLRKDSQTIRQSWMNLCEKKVTHLKFICTKT